MKKTRDDSAKISAEKMPIGYRNKFTPVALAWRRGVVVIVSAT
jgi:hypothetical protein